MGLTIHYSLKARAGDAQARKIITALHGTARDLPFQEISEIVELTGGQCDSNQHGSDDELGWLLVQAEESVELVRRRRVCGGQVYRAWLRVKPTRLLAFTTWPGKGCEEANFGLCRYPATVDTPDGPLKTQLYGWHWSSFCKTQYASDPRYGGVANFLKCHLAVIAMLDRAKELGCLARVSDEGGFWEKRDLSALAGEIGSWNQMLAAYGGKLKDLLGDGQLGVQSAIANYPNFEQLEATGQDKLPPGCEQLIGLIQRVGQLQENHAASPRVAGNPLERPGL
jgi:hypothetical protein